jgi:capsular exopolysaccharide synthesis family protein
VVTDRWQLVAIIAALTLALSLLQYAVTPREYRATALIQIDRRIGVSLKGIEDVWLDSFYNMEYYPTQYRLLTSRGLAERVVLNLRLDEDAGFNPGAANAVAKPGTAADDAVVGGLAGQVLGGLEVNPLRNTQLVEVSYRSRSPELAARVANGVVDAYIDWGIETRTQVVGKASSFYAKQIETLKQEIQDKEAQLQAYSRHADIVSLDPATNVTLKRLEALNQDFITAMSQRINSEARLNELLSASNDRATEILDDKLVADQRSELLEMEREYASKLNVYKPEWPAMVELKAKIDGARRNLVQVTAQALERSRESARADVQLAVRREQSLANELNQAKAENRQLSTAAVEYNILQGEISTRRALLDELLRKQSETDVSSRLQATGESNVRVVDKALVPGGPFRPSLSRSLSMGLGIGFAAGIGLVFLLHYMDRTIKSSEEVERVLQLPVLSVVPDVSQEAKGGGLLGRYGYGYGYGHGYGAHGYGTRTYAERGATQRGEGGKPARRRGADSEDIHIELLPHFRPRLAVAEAYRSLRTALLLSSAQELKTIVVTSAVPGEGKTSTAGNLAVVLSQLGRRVLLVDGDLRKPRVHEVFKISNRVGLVNYLTGSSEIEKIVFRSEIENLYLTPSGPIPPNPSELLASERMREFARFAREKFDMVVFDTAPTLAVADGILLGVLADGVVLCLRAGFVHRRDARVCRDRLMQSEVRVLGAVLNRHRALQGRYRGRYGTEYETYGQPQGEAPKSGIAAL